MDASVQSETQRQRRSLETLLTDTITDTNIRKYIFGVDDLEEIEDSLCEYRQYPLYIKNVLSLAFYFSYACYRYDMDFGDMESERMSNHNAKRVIRSLRDAFVRFPVTQELIQYVLTDIQFDLAQGKNSELNSIFGDLTNRDMSRFSFNPYFKLISDYDKAPSRFKCIEPNPNTAEIATMLRELLETLTFLEHYTLQQDASDMFAFVSKNNNYCKIDSLPLNHIFFQTRDYSGGIYRLFSVETRNQSPITNNNVPPLSIVLRYLSGSSSLTFDLSTDNAEKKPPHLANQRSDEVYMEITGWEVALKSRMEQIVKATNSIDQIHTINYKYIKNLALAISDAISANAGSKDFLRKSFSKDFPYIFVQNNNQVPQSKDDDEDSLDWDAAVIMLLIEVGATLLLERLICNCPQTFYDIVANLYNRTGLELFNSKKAKLDLEVKNIYDTKLVVGEASGFGKISITKPFGRLLARAKAMFIISNLAMLDDCDQDEKLIDPGNLNSNISLLKNMGDSVECEKRVRHACIILSETLKHLLCFYSGLYRYGEIIPESRDECKSKAGIASAQAKLENEFLVAAKAKATELSKAGLEADRPRDTLKLFRIFIDFCDSTSKGTALKSQHLYNAVGKYEIIDKRILEAVYTCLDSVIDDPYANVDTWVHTTLEILEYFKTGSFSNTAYDYNLLNTIYPFTAEFNRGKENPDGHKTVNFSLNIDIDNDSKPDHQSYINVLSEFSYRRREAYYCLPNVIRSNNKWWFDPVLINFRKFNDIFTDTGKECV